MSFGENVTLNVRLSAGERDARDSARFLVALGMTMFRLFRSGW